MPPDLMNKCLFLLLACAVLTGCESMSERMQERFTAVPPKVQVFEAGKKEVFFAGKLAAQQIGFTLERSSESSGKISAFSRIRPGDSVRAAQQFTIDVQLTAITDTTTEVAVRLSELNEGDLRLGGGEVPLREHGLYSSYFDALQRALTEGLGAKTAGEKP